MQKPILEACVESLEQALLAEQCGADRIELCANLETGGLTPSGELISAAKQHLKIPIMVIIRPRAGDFVYGLAEILEMERAILLCRKIGVDGVVLGCLTKIGEVDVENTKRLAALALPMQVTFHKAVDEANDPIAALKSIMEIPGITRVLTSGGAKTAEKGKTVLIKMLNLAGDKITILVAGKVTKENLGLLHSIIGAKEYHGRRIVF